MTMGVMGLQLTAQMKAHTRTTLVVVTLIELFEVEKLLHINSTHIDNTRDARANMV